MTCRVTDLIDEYRQFINPVILGGDTPYFTPLTEPLDLRLTESRTFNSGVVYLRYRRTR
jgi:dihydrofolate reductase